MTDWHAICDRIIHWLAQPRPERPGWPVATWRQFRHAGRVHGVTPLLHEKLQTQPWLDEATRGWLADQAQFNERRVARLQVELAEILALFAAHGVPLMPLKGPLLAAAFYPHPGLRPMADLDLLIRPEDFQAAAGLLSRLGYEPEIKHWKHIAFSRPGNRQVVSAEVEHPDNPRPLEIHLACRETFGGPLVDLTGLMRAHARPGLLLGQPALLPSAGALWLHLLVHATYHFWQGRGRLLHLVDLAMVAPHLNRPPEVLDQVDARFTYPALALLGRCFPAALKPDLLACQAGRVSPAFRRWAAGLDLVNNSYLNPRPPGLYLSRALRFSEGRPGEVLKALRFAALPRLDELALDHPHLVHSRVPWLAYFLLPLDWWKRGR